MTRDGYRRGAWVSLIILGTLGAGFLLGWLGARHNTVERIDVESSSAAAPQRARPVLAPTGREGSSGWLPRLEAFPVSIPATNAPPVWEKELAQVLNGEGPDAEKNRQLLEIFPTLSEGGQVQAALHLSQALPDAEYSSLASYVTNSSLPESVLGALIAGLLSRPDSLKLPLLLEVAQDPEHPKAMEARDLLQVLVQGDYGRNWDQWQTRIQELLAQGAVNTTDGTPSQ